MNHTSPSTPKSLGPALRQKQHHAQWPGKSQESDQMGLFPCPGAEEEGRNPTDDNFGPSPAQAGPNTYYPNDRFLSYYVQLLLQQHLISSVKLTCLMTI